MPEAALTINGQLQPVDGLHLSARDRGFLLGDGLFETIRVRRGRAVRWTLHLARLLAGASVIKLPIPWSDAELATILDRTLVAGQLREAVVRLTVSRGVSQRRGLLPDPDALPTLVVHAAPFDGYPPQLYERGMHAIVSNVRRHEGSPLARIKSLNYLENILARREAAAQGADEALVLNTAGDLAGASAANVFVVLDGRVVTPPLASGALPGTVRQALLDRFSDRVTERPVALAEVTASEEAFLTNALMGVMPLTALNHDQIGAGRPGALTLALAEALAASEDG